MRILILLLVLSISIASCNGIQTKNSPAAATDYKVPDDSAITQAVHDAYACISFKTGAPAYDKISNYFVPQAQLINYRGDTAQYTSLNQFINFYKQFIETNHIGMFHEDELFGRTEQFGRVAHRISTYNTYLNTMDSASERGVNSFQLIKTPQGWKVSSIIWDVEKPSLKVPAYYLK